MSELIVEFYSEEMPAGLQKWAAVNIETMILNYFKKENLDYKKSEFFWTPMRLSFLISGLPIKTLNLSVVKRGPRIGASKEAIDGFSSKLGIKKSDLRIKNTSKGKFYFYKTNKIGVKTSLIIESAIRNVIFNFPWKKSMRWGKGDLRWIRPLHSILCVFNGTPIKFKIGDISTSNKTFGHRFMSKNEIIINSKREYIKKLKDLNVILDANKRVEIIINKAKIISKKSKLLFKPNLNLVNEVSNLVENPQVFLGVFDKSFLKLPNEIIELTMVKQQKYFPLYKMNSSLSNKFLGVSNIKIKKNSQIINGNSRVLKARLSDAKFFYDNDLKKGLKNYCKELRHIIFHSELGFMDQKVQRISKLCKNYSINFNAKSKLLSQSVLLAKADLCTEVVYEMPELQGFIGAKYAEKEGLSNKICTAIREHYSPLGPSDDCPTSPESSALSFSDKVDSLVGFLMIGEKPSGSRDPFGLRRASLGIIRIIIEKNIRISLLEVINFAIKNYRLQNFKVNYSDNQIASLVLDFIYERFRFYLKDKGITYDKIEAVLSVSLHHDLFDSFQKIISLNKLMESKEGLELISILKRVRRILYLEEKKIGSNYSGKVNKTLLRFPEEKDLYSTCIKNTVLIKKAFEKEDYEKALLCHKGTKTKLDVFFNNVLVDVEDSDIKTNRLNLLSLIRDSFAEYSDFSLIDVGS